MTLSHRTRRCHAGHLWQGDGWTRDGIFGIDPGGMLQAVDDGPAETLGAWVLPGMPNLHSHAFQRAMAGLAERRGKVDDSFSSWRETMYRFAATVGPDELKAI